MIRYEHTRITMKIPSEANEETHLTLRYAASVFGFLLNRSDMRGQWTSFDAFASLILQHYTASPQVNNVVETLRSLNVNESTQSSH